MKQQKLGRRPVGQGVRLAFMHAAALAIAILSLSACDVSIGNGDFSIGVARGKATDEWTRNYALAASGRVEVINVNGSIEVEAAEGGQVEVRAQRTAKARTDEAAQELLRQLEIKEDIRPDLVRLETRPPSRLLGASQEIRYRLKVPRGAQLELRTTNGGVTIAGVSGHVRASSTNGAVIGRALSGGVEASTTNGGIRLDLDAVSGGEIDLETVNGGIQLQVPETAKAEISARCVNGGIRVSGLQLERISETSRRRLDARLNGGGPRITIETTNGGIRITGKSAAGG